jgi:hypothetical protein
MNAIKMLIVALVNEIDQSMSKGKFNITEERKAAFLR